MQSAGDRVLPELLPGGRVEAVNAVVAGAADDLAIGHRGRRFGVAVRLELPQLLAGGGVDGEQLAVFVRVIAFADEQPAVGVGG